MNVAEPLTPDVVTPPPRATIAPPRPDPYANPPSDKSFEVVQGRIVEKTLSIYEKYIASLLGEKLSTFCRDARVGRTVVEGSFAIPGSGNDRIPDVAFVSYHTWPATRRVPKVNAWGVAPDIAIEVVSPTDRMFDVLEKAEEYFRGGVNEVWLVFSNVEKVYAYSSPTSVRVFARGDVLVGDPVLPGFRLPLADLFPEPEPDPAAPAA